MSVSTSMSTLDPPQPPPNCKMHGSELIMDLGGMSFDKLNDVDFMCSLLEECSKIGRLEILARVRHIFSPQGVTVMFLLSTSHITVHTWPEYGTCCFNLFTCLSDYEFDEIIDYIRRKLEPTAENVRTILR